MATDVLMPQMGESIAEGTIVKWLKKVGDTVQRDEPLLEISTDKVDAEIPSPGAGVLAEILGKEGESLAATAVIDRLGEAGSSDAAAKAPNAPATPTTGESGPARDEPAIDPAPQLAASPTPPPAEKKKSDVSPSAQPAPP